MTTQMNVTYINALLADASYVELTNANGDVVPETEITSKLKARVGRNSLRIAPYEKSFFRRITFH